MKHILFSALAMSVSYALANTTTTVTQVTTAVTVEPDVDYVITSKTPFGDDGQIEISGNSTLILKNVIPSEALRLASHIRIDGVAAHHKSNCMFKVYGGGTIVLAHGTGIQPFVAYTGTNQEGDSKAYNVGSRLSLAGTSMNNSMESFTLRRGYMVCLANKSDGTGYSRVFVADTEDRKVNLPQVLKDKVSSIRVMQWNDCGKRGYSGGDVATLDALNATWYYDWNCGGVATDDWEYVPQHHHEGWPGISDIGASSHSPHALGNNEPDNTGDAREQVNTVDEVLANWPAMMATGKRLGSPAVSGNYNWLYAFIDSIDARGWRCDFIAVHAYWYNDWPSWKSTLQGIANRTGRPIWITEMNYGANWTGWPGHDTSGSEENFAIEKQHFAPVIDGLEASDFMERYAVYNWVQDCRSMYLNGKLTPMGQYYADVETHVGYKANKEKVPNTPRQYNPGNLTAAYDKTTHQVALTWKDMNGEYNRSMEIQLKKPGTSIWNTVKNIVCQEDAATYTELVDGLDGYVYRIRIVDVSNKERLSNEATAVNENIQPGDEVTLGETTMYLGGNLLVNGSFDFGFTGWTSGTGEVLSAPYFQVIPKGGIDGGAYLQCYGGSTNAKDVTALRKVMEVERGASYYVSIAGCYGDPKSQRISTTSNPSLELNVRVSLPAVSEWAKQASSFTVSSDTLLMIQMRNLAGKTQLDEVVVARLFSTREEALAEALVCERLRAAAMCEYYEPLLTEDSGFSFLLQQLKDARDNATSSETLAETIAQASKVLRLQNPLLGLLDDATTMSALKYPGYADVFVAVEVLRSSKTAGEWLDAYEQLDQLIADRWRYTRSSDEIENPKFVSSVGWNTLAGTYRGGDQRLATQAGMTCWNAWWNVSANNAAYTMAINQPLLGLSHGLYALECKATTQHLCETDQHAYMTIGDNTASSQPIDLGLLDLPSFADTDKWRTLATSWLYVADDDTVTIGFEGSKQGAVDGSWIPYANPTNAGDNRNGWWCATDFRMRYVPVFRREADVTGWGTICLPNNISVPDDVTLYQIAGILSNNTAVCLEPVTMPEAGTPYIFKVGEGSMVHFFEGADKVSSPKTNVNGLRGAFLTTAKYPVGALVLENGVWQYIPDSESRYAITSYSGFIQKVANVPVLSSWDGVTLPTSGLETGLESISADQPQEGTSYNLAGQRAQSSDNVVIRNGSIKFQR